MSTEFPITDAQMGWIDLLQDGTRVRIRALAPSDGPRERAFLSRLPSRLRDYRFLGLIKPLDDEVIRELTCVDPCREVSLGAFTLASTGGEETEIGAAHYLTDAHGSRCDCSVTVDPAWQKRGVGRVLMRHLIEVAQRRGVRRMYAVDGTGHGGAHALAEHLGFHCRPDPEDPLITVFELVLQD